MSFQLDEREGGLLSMFHMQGKEAKNKHLSTVAVFEVIMKEKMMMLKILKMKRDKIVSNKVDSDSGIIK